MKTLKELQRFAEELSSADRLLCDAIAEGTYRLGKLSFSEPVLSMVRSVLNDLMGHQESPDLTMFEGEDPYKYMVMNAGEEEEFKKLMEDNPEVVLTNPDFKEYGRLIRKIHNSLTFAYFTLASRRDKKEERTLDLNDKYELLDYLAFGYDPVMTMGMGYGYYEMFARDRYRPYESKLIVEIPYCEFLAHFKQGRYEEDYFSPFGLSSKERSEEFIKAINSQKDLPEKVKQDLMEKAIYWEFYKISPYGVAIFYSQGVLYNEDAYKPALKEIDRLKPQNKVEHLLLARALENLGRNLKERTFLREASKHYQIAGNFVKALECEVI
ncbi:hypothetical protein [Hydrogenobacter hydrogenophilus]|uniref:Uncharacterized protein n=1 Tax=Hydrogenobacter hydrogenophilus TaxID=35835 RepID=A0A285P638_9AQUI|nr:hypothetical protein [Hydrogenobacter hydrogenophilus]SNZ15616.1 hypothetical protein SAMN06265353_1415 [Hydrogenobacter hydrogenophilus]